MIGMLLFPTLHKVICECVLSFKLLAASRTYKHHISSLTFYIYYIIFFYKNQERFIYLVRRVLYTGVLLLSFSGRHYTIRFRIRLTANRPHVLSHQKQADRILLLIIGWLLSSPPLRFSEIYLLVPSKRTLTYMAAPLGLEPRKPASETGVLPIRLKGNINTSWAFHIFTALFVGFVGWRGVG